MVFRSGKVVWKSSINASGGLVKVTLQPLLRPIISDMSV